MLGLILALIIAVAAFNLVATLVMTVTDKRADIAILRTLGASPRSVMVIFMVQGALVGLIGTLRRRGARPADRAQHRTHRAGDRAGARHAIAAGQRLPDQPHAERPAMADIVPVALISIGLALLATLYPSWRASRVDPAQALRYD